jgi:hypothetical protein
MDFVFVENSSPVYQDHGQSYAGLEGIGAFSMCPTLPVGHASYEGGLLVLIGSSGFITVKFFKLKRTRGFRNFESCIRTYYTNLLAGDVILSKLRFLLVAST